MLRLFLHFYHHKILKLFVNIPGWKSDFDPTGLSALLGVSLIVGGVLVVLLFRLVFSFNTQPWICGTARICFQHFSPTQFILRFNIQGFGWPDDQGRDPVESWIHRHRGLAPPPSQASPQGGRHCPCHPCHLCLPHHHHHLNHHNHHCPIILILMYQHPILLHPFVHYNHNHNHNHIKILQI